MSAHLTVYAMAAAAEHPVLMRHAEQARRIAEAESARRPCVLAAWQRLGSAVGRPRRATGGRLLNAVPAKAA